MDGPSLTAKWMDGTFRVFDRLDVLMPQWADVTLMRLKAQHRMGSGPEPTLPMVYHRLLRMVLCDEMDLRIVNGTVFFAKNDVMSMQLRQFSDAEADLVLDRWFLLFGQRTAIGAGHDYSKGLHPRVADSHLPRFEMAARFMCTQLRADVQASEDGTPGVVNCPYGFGVYYAFVSALSILLQDPQTRERAALLHDILFKRHMALFESWNDKAELYPGYAGDIAAIAAVGKKTPPQKTHKTASLAQK